MDEKAKKSLGSGKEVDHRPRIVVAIPVCDEREGITACLDGLVAQIGLEFGTFGIVLFLNNCTDGTDEIVRRYVSTPWKIRVLKLDDLNASAGWARRIAMEAASEWLAEGGHDDGVLLTTDADSRVRLDWVARNLAALAAGADAVAGRIVLDPDDAARLPDHLHARGRLEGEYETLLTEIDARLDPQRGNPWPNHWSKSGATIAVRWSAYKHVGGMPDMPSGEDRAFIDAVRPTISSFAMRLTSRSDTIVAASDQRASGTHFQLLEKMAKTGGRFPPFSDDELKLHNLGLLSRVSAGMAINRRGRLRLSTERVLLRGAAPAVCSSA